MVGFINEVYILTFLQLGIEYGAPGAGLMGFLAAFWMGVLAFLSPCVFPMIPAYLGYITGFSFDGSDEGVSPGAIRKKTLLHSLFFVLGFTLIFVLLGATATSISYFLHQYKEIVLKVAGVIIFFFGLQMTVIIKLEALLRERRMRIRKKPLGFVGSLVVGIAFGAGWTPCMGPFLGSILALAATYDTVGQGMALLASYSLGVGLPFLLAGLAFNSFLAVFRKMQSALLWINRAAGGLLILLGILVFFDLMPTLYRLVQQMLG